MKRGEQGDAVAILQQALVDQGFSMPVTTANGREPPDGIYGSETQKMVWIFQGKHQLSRDGIAGHDTLHKLDELFTPPPPTPTVIPPPPVRRQPRVTDT